MSAEEIDDSLLYSYEPANYERDANQTERVEMCWQIEKMSRKLEAQRHRAHVSIVGSRPEDHVSADGLVKIRDVRLDEVAALMKWTQEWARKQIAVSRALVMRLPRVLAMLEAGEISAYNAVIIAEGLQDLFSKTREDIHNLSEGVEITERYGAIVEPRAAGKTVAEMKRTVRKAVVALAPLPADELHELASLNRRVDMSLAPDGMCWVNAYLPSVEGQRVMNAIKAMVEKSEHLTGTDAQNKADAFVSLVCSSNGEGGTGAEVQVLVSLETLLGVSNEPGTIHGNKDLMTAAAVRALAEESRLRRIVYDPLSKQILEYGRETYRPPVALRDHVVARDQVCRYPGCSRDASTADLDHVTPWEDGGPTNKDNLVALCRRHHNLKTHAGWNYMLMPDDSVRWVSPSGVKLTDPPRHITD
ncbi:MAG: hypothetical protein RL441_953 [Actinomycetota bacterium]